MKMFFKAFICLFLLINATTIHAISFKIEGTYYDQNQYRNFIYALRRIFVNADPRNPGTQDIIIKDDHGYKIRVTLNLAGLGDVSALYITRVNGIQLTDQEQVYPHNYNPFIDHNELSQTISLATEFRHLSENDRKKIVLRLAYLISEAIRFKNVEDRVNYALNHEQGGVFWSETEAEIHSWDALSRFISANATISETAPRRRNPTNGRVTYVGIPPILYQRYFVSVNPGSF